VYNVNEYFQNWDGTLTVEKKILQQIIIQMIITEIHKSYGTVFLQELKLILTLH
jgi:hypothetical protein